MRCRRRSWKVPSSICGCWSIIASGWSASASRSTTRCNGICTTSGPNCELPGSSLFYGNWGPRVARRLARAEQTMRVRIARDELRRIRELSQTIKALEGEIAAARRPDRAAAAHRARLRAADRGQARRRDRRRRPVRQRRQARARRRRRSDPGQLRQDQPPPPRPRRQPPDQRDHPPHRRHPPALPPRDPGLHRPQTRRRQEHQRSHPLPQTPPRPPHLAPPPARPTPDQDTAITINLLT